MLKQGLFFIAFICFLNSTLAQDNSGFADFNYYRDSRGFNNFTLNLGADLQNNFQYFSFINLNPENSPTDLGGYYTEHHLRWAPYPNKAWDITQLWTSASGENNDHLQYGIRWKLNETKALNNFFNSIKGFFFINFHAIQIRSLKNIGGFPQVEYVYRFNVLGEKLKDRLYLMGFADQIFNYNDKLTQQWVSEHQLGYKIKGAFYLVAEYRINTFLPKASQHALGLGLEYVIVF